MRKTILSLTLITAAVAIMVISCNNNEPARTSATAISNDSLIKRGSYLVNAIGCDDCHSPKIMGSHGPEIIPELRFGGYPAKRPVAKVDTNVIKNGWVMLGPDLTNAVGPWGMSFAGNISSDETGIGTWSEKQFFKVLREGKFKGLDGSRDLLPPMPWFVYKNMTDDDIRSIFAYLKSTKPVNNIVPAPKMFPDL
ncbi:MAG TPA: c-type cytochrome [Ferruginibacter sp.]|nr:c-type cytochrome [Ferruginibacter sp.]